ncbi:methyltransferase domain-containing protein [Bradyrhizobium sp. 193]|uniref:class I SAM-dependent methyltransferase n=1 Tax=unclassified Bradyrhizobium TaxID=2631580 RepID=UPI001FF76785|nr:MULTISPECIES: methyltransferase domain-containing protein [unclassified Bradyrhizobium]MCK1468496.1 methyltransferase domain-containing protein [Bradyrhizobium sp. CW10]MCK1482256.1 methyltransferase domain-containing protein [Bradyrhizobium sp. 193]MCK1584770.1 methyltransferase domain-containing protein [Bradyrhizobium sp. 168]UPK09265.1 methyltransferase domain-containing protein [Bradyrhizobium sp. 155]UPK21981.1 methyltransferase domain-containing protein [Bradyrhizobium sp. 131]
MIPGIADQKASRLLVVIASYGTANNAYLDRVIQEYRSMSFDVDIVIISNIDKKSAADIECVVGLPNKNPWSLPFAHKELFAARADQYDLFIYSEDDILITERNIRAFLDVTSVLNEDEVAGWMLVERASNGELNYPQAHGSFHWDCTAVKTRGNYHLAHFTNEHAASYMLTRQQLARAIASGGFLVGPHEGKYDLPCTAATDPFTQCGFRKLIPISHIDDFSAHHLPNKYINRLGVDRRQLDAQLSVLMQIAREGNNAVPLFSAETRLWHGMYSKDYYEPARDEVLSAVPQSAAVLSIGSCSAANERRLLERGNRVVTIPLDPVVGSGLAQLGAEVVLGDVITARSKIAAERFDRLLFVDVLQFIRDPAHLLKLFADLLAPDGRVIICAPNRPSLRYAWECAKSSSVFRRWGSFDAVGIHDTTTRKIQRWCAQAGLAIEKVERRAPHRAGLKLKFLSSVLAPDLVATATRRESLRPFLRKDHGMEQMEVSRRSVVQ